jgi:hypothetical protein
MAIHTLTHKLTLSLSHTHTLAPAHTRTHTLTHSHTHTLTPFGHCRHAPLTRLCLSRGAEIGHARDARFL